MRPLEKYQHARNILVTTALPYANGPLHLGHILEGVQADIWVRFQKLRGYQCLFVSGDDAHGTSIMVSAKQQNTSPEALISAMYQSHRQDFTDFLVAFDQFHTTHSEQNRELLYEIYEHIKKEGDIFTRTISQAFDPEEKMFLPDRFIRGQCPRCQAKNQYGDACEQCGATYSPTELIDPISTLSGLPPIEKESEHFFFNLTRYSNFLAQWLKQQPLQPEVKHKLEEWFGSGLTAWDISRDAPYFGFTIPGCVDKFFYVWLDAPFGYMAAVKKLADNNPAIQFQTYWAKDSTAELHHFIGKDIIYFHGLFWPAVLHSAGFRLPTRLQVHGYLTINGHKMSKSRGTFITARKFLEHFNPEYLRYYFAAKLQANIEDIDFTYEDFKNRVNADLVGKFINIASRCASFINRYFHDTLSDELPNPKLFQDFVLAGEEIAHQFETLEFNKAIRSIMVLADQANSYLEQQKPWVKIHDPEQFKAVQAICTQGLNLFKILATYLKPILPDSSLKIETFLNVPPLTWQTIEEPLLSHRILTFSPLLQRISADAILSAQQ